MKKKIAIIDFGTSNLKSINAAFNLFDVQSSVTTSLREINNSDAVVLPGVGAFAEAMSFLKKNRIDQAIKTTIYKKKPFLGICLGMQLLFDSSEEFNFCSGLGILKGKVMNLKKLIRKHNIIIPNTGWYSLQKNAKFKKKNILKISKKKYYYFTHSFFVKPADEKIVSSKIEIEKNKICSSIQKDNVYAFQFHPEKSGPEGLDIINNFCKKV